jgi:hypothetical protein
VIDYGHPQNSDIEALKLYITQAKNKNKLAAVAVRLLASSKQHD